METVLNNLIILNESVQPNLLVSLFIWEGAISIVLSIAFLVLSFFTYLLDVNIPFCVFMIIAGILLVIGGIVFYNILPYRVDLYIATNGVELSEISEYFNVTELTEFDNVTTCHITPKSDYYNEALVLLGKG